MTFLIPDKIIKVTINGETLKINQKIIPDSLKATKYIASFVQKGEPLKPCQKLNDGTGIPKGVTNHNTGDIKTPSATNPAEQYCRATYNGNMGGVVVHFYVYKSEIWQLLNENERGWHAADGSSRRLDHRGTQTGGNLDTIAIECIGASAESEDTTAKLTAYLCSKYQLDPKLDVYTHNYWMYGVDKLVSGARKNCPIYILPHWAAYLSKVNEYFTKPAAISNVLYRVQTGAFSSKANATAFANKLKSKGFATYMIKVGLLYKVQVGAFGVKANASAMVDKLQKAGYAAFITTQSGTAVAIADADTVNEIVKGSKVKVKTGATDFTGKKLKSYVYNMTYTVISVSGERVVIGIGRVVTAAMREKDLILQ